jgi:hypothetical protein
MHSLALYAWWAVGAVMVSFKEEKNSNSHFGERTETNEGSSRVGLLFLPYVQLIAY